MIFAITARPLPAGGDSRSFEKGALLPQRLHYPAIDLTAIEMLSPPGICLVSADHSARRLETYGHAVDYHLSSLHRMPLQSGTPPDLCTLSADFEWYSYLALFSDFPPGWFPARAAEQTRDCVSFPVVKKESGATCSEVRWLGAPYDLDERALSENMVSDFEFLS
jgi:hypothetical protein